MPNYQDAKIYKIISPSRPDLLPYYGATIVALCKRMVQHRCLKANPCKARELILVGDAIILLEENYPCNSKEELSKKEAEYILNNDCCNKVIPLRTQKEYNEKNKDKICEQKREYREKNKDKLCEQKREYNEKNKDKLCEQNKEWYEKNKDKRCEQTREYYEKNKDKLCEQKREYYEKNKDKRCEQTREYREKNKQKVLCECGSNVSKLNLSTHQKSKKHQDFLRQQL